jgi:signal peptidase I
VNSKTPVPRTGWARARNQFAIWFPWLILAGALAVIWPVRFGGSTSFMIVSGHSMDPTYHTGDLVITKARPKYAIGEVVVYTIPGSGAGAGREVVHRLHEVLPDGKLLAKGDNNRTADPWPIMPSDIVGSKWVMVPKGGIILGFLRSILMLAVLFGVLVTWVFWPRDDNDEDEEVVTAAPALAVHEPHWLDDDAIIADWDTLLAPPTPQTPLIPTASAPTDLVPTKHWLDDDGFDDVWNCLHDTEVLAGS